MIRQGKSQSPASYNAASESYDDPANSFWKRFGQRTVDRLQLTPGARVLDAQSREHVRQRNLEFVATSGLTSVEANVIYAIATKPQPNKPQSD